ncbi:MAG: TM2 domain-containing protein [Gammaproteobacteria bacterium]|nr:TM2 domain-containing protein [Gammaproteobacteria bacterium]
MTRERDLVIAYILWLTLGIIGAHKLYLRRPRMALLYLFTAGLCLIGWIIDLFTMARQVDDCNDRIYEEDEGPTFMEEHLEDRIDELEDQVEELRHQLRNQ